MDILYVDNHLLVVNKPAGLATQPSIHHEDSLETRAKAWIKEEYRKPGEVFLHAVHRLDKSVSGIVIFARTSKALSRLNEALREHKMKKTYLAYVEGTLHGAKVLEDYLVHDEFKARVSSKKDPQAKKAILHYKVIKNFDHKTLLEVELTTGRYHQIRVQLANTGHPIIGDTKYGSSHVYQDHHIDLHHGKVEFEHPVKKESLSLLSKDYLKNR